MRSDFAIETAGLTKQFGRRRVVDALTLAVPHGSVFALLGRSGAGKTTTIRMLLGFLRPNAGASRVLGEDSRALTPELRGRVGYMTETHPLHDWMTVLQEGYFASRFHARWNAKLFKSIIDRFGLSLDARVRDLSRGERAGVSLAITMAPLPELLILDDPATGLDPVARKALTGTLLQVTRESGRTVLLSSHLLDDVERMADHVAVLDQGTLRASGSIDELSGAMSQYRLSFAPGTMPAELPEIRGLLSAKRHGDTLILLVERPAGDTAASVAGLGAIEVDERPASFTEAVVAWLGDEGDQGSLIDASALSAVGGV